MIKTFIIRLEENEHSCKMAEDCMQQAKIFGLRPSYFKAIHGKDSDYHYDITGIKKQGKFKKNKIGVIGCFFSHYYLWKKCIKLNEPILILEHDGYMIRPIDSLMLDSFSDVLKLDRLDPYSKNYEKDLIEESSIETVSVQQYFHSSKKVIKHGLRDYFKGAYSYIIKPQGAKKLINFIKINGHRPADQQINARIVSLKTTVPTVARLHPFYAIENNIETASLTRNL
jgi:glycosyl transferase family 25